MMRMISITILTAVALLASLPTIAGAAEAKRPLVLLFETAKGEGADRQIAESTTKALRTYFRESQRVEATAFNKESPTVLRAIMDKKLTAEKIASYSSQTERIEVAKVLGFDYAAGAEVSIKTINVVDVSKGLVATQPEKPAEPAEKKATDKDSPVLKETVESRPVQMIEIKLWVAQVDGGKNAKWESVGTASMVGERSTDIDNAIQSAASSAVIEITNKAFGSLPRVPDPTPTTGDESSALVAPAGPNSPAASDYAAQAEESLKLGDYALAIQQYSRAVGADPTNGALRLKLANAYGRKGMYTEAAEEIDGAEKLGADSKLLAQTRADIERMRGGKASEPAPDSKPVNNNNRVLLTGDSNTKNPNRAPAIAKILEGDKLWAAGKPDEAAAAYKESIRLNSADWRAHERLAVVNASMSLFGESRKALEQLARVQPQIPLKVATNRYEMLRKAFDKQFGALLKQYDSDSANFSRQIITRESYYTTVKGLSMRLESMASFLDAITVPQSKQTAHLRRSAACGLAAQAAGSLLDYLESNTAKSRTNANVFAAQAKSELEAATKLDEADKVIVAKEKPAAPPNREQPGSDEQPAPTAEQPGPDGEQPTPPGEPVGPSEETPPPPGPDAPSPSGDGATGEQPGPPTYEVPPDQ